MITFPTPTLSQFTAAGKLQRTASARPNTKEKQQAIDALKHDPVESVITWYWNAQVNDGCQNSATRPALTSVANSSPIPIHSAENGVDSYAGMEEYGRAESDIALGMPIPSTSSTISLPPNMANASARSSGPDQSTLFTALPETMCAPLGFKCSRGLITDANLHQSSEPSHELTGIEPWPGKRSGFSMNLPSRDPPNASSGKFKVKKVQKFACIYCERAFSQRHDFKRHFKDSHESDDIYNCDYSNCSKGFFLADKFTTHHQKSHGCGQRSDGPEQKCQHAEICRSPNREQRARRGCGACFHCSDTLDGWLDHVAVHYINGFKKKDWNDVLVFSSLLNQPEIIEAWGKLTSDPFPEAGWSTEHRDRLQSNMERNVMNPADLAREIFTTSDKLKLFAPSTSDTGVFSFPPRSHNLLSPTNDQSIPMASAQSSYTANQAFDMEQYTEDGVALIKPLDQYPDYTSTKHVIRAPCHSYARTARETHQIEEVTKQQYPPLSLSYLGPNSAITKSNQFQPYSNSTPLHSITHPHATSDEKYSTIRRPETDATTSGHGARRGTAPDIQMLETESSF